MNKTLLRVLLVLCLVAVIILIAGFVFLDQEAWKATQKLSAALKGARGVVLVEYAGNVEIARKTATPHEISQLREAASAWPRPFFPSGYLCFVPHHRIEIVRSDGSEWISAICFLCDKFAVNEEPYLTPLPPYLAKSLTSFFTSVGMAPKTHEEYTALERSPDTQQNDKAHTETAIEKAERVSPHD